MVKPNTILLIDDNIEFLTTLELQLGSEGYRVFTAQNAQTGFEEIERCQPDLILIDWELPDMDGIELIKQIKLNPQHHDRYIIMITGRGGTKNIVQGLDAGANDYLHKLFEKEELMARIRCGMRIRELEQRIVEETKHSTMLEMAVSISDRIGNPIAAAKLYHHMLMEKTHISSNASVSDALKTIGQLLDEALSLINEYQSIKKPLQDFNQKPN